MGYVYGSKSERSVCSRAYILKGFQIFYLVYKKSEILSKCRYFNIYIYIYIYI